MSEHEVSSSKLAGYTGHGQECPAGLETYHCFPGSIGVCGYLAGSGTSCIGTARRDAVYPGLLSRNLHSEYPTCP